MSLLNRNSVQPNTIIVEKVVRNRKTESFGDSFFADAKEAAGPATDITNAISRRRAMKAIEKRNKLIQTPSEYIDMLMNAEMGNSYSVAGKMDESKFFAYIANFCQAEMDVYKRNERLGNVSPKLEEMLKNPPALTTSNIKRNLYCQTIMLECKKDLAKVGIAFLKDKMSKKED